METHTKKKNDFQDAAISLIAIIFLATGMALATYLGMF